MILVLPCRCLCSIHWKHVFSREWWCSWSSTDRCCSNYIWVINNLIAYYAYRTHFFQIKDSEIYWCSWKHHRNIHVYSRYSKSIWKLFSENRNVHDYATRQVDHIHIAYACTNRHNMTMRFQGGKVWNSIVRNKIPYNGRIYIFKREFKSFLLNCYTWAGGP